MCQRDEWIIGHEISPSFFHSPPRYSIIGETNIRGAGAIQQNAITQAFHSPASAYSSPNVPTSRFAYPFISISRIPPRAVRYGELRWHLLLQVEAAVSVCPYVVVCRLKRTQSLAQIFINIYALTIQRQSRSVKGADPRAPNCKLLVIRN